MAMKRAEGGVEMEEAQKKELCKQLGITDSSLFFLVLIILGTLLSFWSVTIQRRQLCLTIEGETELAAAAPPIYPIKHASSALIVGSLGFFLCLAYRAWKDARAGDDCVARRSSSTNLWASILVLSAAILRFEDLNFVEDSRQSALLEADVLPD